MSGSALSTAERAPIYGFLTRLLLYEIDAETWNKLRDPVIVAFFERAQPGFGEWIAQSPTPARLETEAEEFARLFLVPGGVPLFASAWLGGDSDRLASDLADFVHEVLETIGREPVHAEPWGRLPLDHLALWLDLIVATTQETPDLADHLEEQLMGPWVLALGEALEVQSRSPLYRATGALLKALNA